MTGPGDQRRATRWEEAAAQVVEAQGEWVLVASAVSNNYAYRIRTGKIAAFQPAGKFEAVSRRREKHNARHVDVWARLAD